MKNLVKKVKEKMISAPKKLEKDKDLEKKVVENVDKALNEYKRVFERLAEYDRT